MSGKSLFTLMLYVTHYLSIAAWVGAMLFNLLVNFPALRDGARGPGDIVKVMSAQARRAAPWLYALVILVAASGWFMQSLNTQAGHQILSDTVVTVKIACILLMLVSHLYGTLHLWPQIHFALEEEWAGLIFKYKCTMLASTTFGILAILASYWSRSGLPT